MFVRDHAGDRIYLAGVDVRVDADILVAFQDHGNLFECGVARALPDTVDRHLHLSGPVQHAFQRVGCCHAQVVMTVGGDDSLVDVSFGRQ